MTSVPKPFTWPSSYDYIFPTFTTCPCPPSSYLPTYPIIPIPLYPLAIPIRIVPPGSSTPPQLNIRKRKYKELKKKKPKITIIDKLKEAYPNEKFDNEEAKDPVSLLKKAIKLKFEDLHKYIKIIDGKYHRDYIFQNYKPNQRRGFDMKYLTKEKYVRLCYHLNLDFSPWVYIQDKFL